MLRSLDISASALFAQRVRLNTISNNLANVNTTRDAEGQPHPYQRKFVLFAPGDPGGAGEAGVHVAGVHDDPTPPRLRYDPGHPDANAEGMVAFPNIDLTTEFVNAMEATRAYEANVAAIEMTKAMTTATLRILG